MKANNVPALFKQLLGTPAGWLFILFMVAVVMAPEHMTGALIMGAVLGASIAYLANYDRITDRKR